MGGSLSVENITPQDIADKIAPAARSQVPEQVQQEMLIEIKRFLETHVWTDIVWCRYEVLIFMQQQIKLQFSFKTQVGG